MRLPRYTYPPVMAQSPSACDVSKTGGTVGPVPRRRAGRACPRAAAIRSWSRRRRRKAPCRPPPTRPGRRRRSTGRRSPRSNENRHGLRRPYAQISGRPPPSANGLSAGTRYAGSPSGRVDAQDLAEQRVERLAVALGRVPGALVARAAAVAEPEVEHAVGAERELAAVVVRLRLVDGEHEAPGRRGRPRTVGSKRVLVDGRVAVDVGVVDVELRAVGGERRARAGPARRPFAMLAGEVEHGRVGRQSWHRRPRTCPPCSAT